MDLNPPQHPFQGLKTPHDFLSLYADPNLNHSDSRSNPGNSMHLTTHDFLQPLERSSNNNSSKENNSNGSGQGQEISSKNGESSVSTASAERVLPGGIGTYSITHISSYTNGKTDITIPNVNGVETKPEISRSPFTLWEEHVDIADGLRIQESLTATNKEKSAYWSTVRPKTELSFHGKSPFTLSSVETAQQMITSTSKQRPQGFAEMMKSFRGVSDDDEDEDEEFGDRIREKRKENMPQKGEQQQKVDGKGNEQKPNTPRSKHSATEQRRRSKINDRFQMLRELVPHSDQKRDKASFLLEVIEYIQLLQEKVRKYETAEQTWNQERKKTTVWDMCKKSSAGGDHGENSHIAIGTHLEKHNELGESTGTIRKSNATNDESCSTSMEIHHNSQSHLTSNKPLMVPGYSSFKGEISSSFNRSIPLTLQMQHASYPPFGRGITNSNHSNGHATSDIHSFQGVNKISVPKTPIVMSSKGVENPWSEWKSSQTSPTTQHDTICNGTAVIKDGEPLGKHGSKLEAHQSNVCFNSSSRMHHNIHQSETGISTRQSQPLSSVDQQSKIDLQSASGEELVIQGGMINVSSVYSQGLLDTLTQALQSSGLDLSQANISVQIDLGRRTSTRSTTNSKQQGQDHNVEGSSQNHQSQGHSRAADTNSESEQPKKRPKIEDN